ncbi:acyl-CoA thioesterase [Lachnospiraceae bacterium PF1-21]|uniref:PaaI family thioesterase n=1 Tax=Ohessyouella blattaphilus TaxID=2949333 RepID=A0ABT1EFZ5_9FIRM|nr:PaaI family thioesterase [Ohessyouella blattaphilus]MCP1109625.1 PaaI family thioesterase [Ohessyouella blattaphilus]MCR8563019.1 PaaI family thioesterase [Ohessyouella blattaphilus]MDL2250858.1 PaaI family thioesterase [Lachnospiraceae bacterium OttesenSCG-928-J05]
MSKDMTIDEIQEYRYRNNPFAKLLGIRTTEVREGYAKGEMKVEEHHYNALRSVHGGCLYTLADMIGGGASSSRGYRMTTLSGDLHFLSPALNVDILYCEAKEIKYGKNIAVYDVAVLSEEGKIFAKGTFSYYNLGKKWQNE